MISFKDSSANYYIFASLDFRTSTTEVNTSIYESLSAFMTLHTSWSQHGSHAYSISLVAACRTRYQVDWGLWIAVVVSRYYVVEHWPEAFVRVLMRFDDYVYTVLEK